MSVTYAYHGGVAPDTAQECQSEGAAIRRAEGMLRDPANVGAVAFKRTGDPNVGEFSDAVLLKRFGDVPEDLSCDRDHGGRRQPRTVAWIVWLLGPVHSPLIQRQANGMTYVPQ